MKKERIPALDFIRVICTLGIIANHYAQAVDDSFLTNAFHTYPSGIGSVGYVCVVVFFMLSGAALYYSNGQPDHLGRFYMKRWKAVYPSFYIAYIMLFIWYIRFNRTFFTGRSPLTLVFTVLGMDGYLAGAVPTWYILGEWFLGAIILCYVLYPLIVYCFKKSEIAACAALVALYALTLNWKMLNQNAFRNIFSCLLSFSCGIVLMKHGWFRSRIAGLISLVLYIVSAFVPVIRENNILSHIQGLLLFLALAAAGQYVMKNRFFAGTIGKGAVFSFEVFLVHHIIVGYVTHFFHPENTVMQLLALLGTVLISGIGGYVVYLIRTWIFKQIAARTNRG